MAESAPEIRRFGGYRVGPVLGAGGMAKVYLAIQSGHLDFVKPVALKLLHPGLAADPVVAAMVRDEARIAARIRHPNVVAVLDVVVENDEVGIVLEYIHGETLSRLLADGPLPVDVVVAVTIDVLHGLQAAHTAVDEHGRPLGIVHRDISPQNIIVGADGVARVLDFGIAKAETRAQVTRDGALKGKLGYMAPEQLGGEADARADLYALALVVWEMLVGVSPFHDADNDGEKLRRVIEGVTTTPASAGGASIDALDALVMKALSPRVAARPAAASEFSASLEALAIAAPRSKVASFVEGRAKSALALREKTVLDLEATSSAASTSTFPRAVFDASTPSTSTPPPPRRRLRVVALGAAVIALVVGTSAVAASVSRRTSLFDNSSTLASAPSVESEALPAPTLRSSASAENEAPIPLPSASTRAATRPLKRRDPMAAPPTRPAPDAGPDCRVPFTVNEQNVRTYRRECYKE